MIINDNPNIKLILVHIEINGENKSNSHLFGEVRGNPINQAINNRLLLFSYYHHNRIKCIHYITFFFLFEMKKQPLY